MADPIDLSGIETDWTLLTGRLIGGDPEARMDMALLHPLLGVVLVQFAPRWTDNAPARLRRELDRARFAAVFHGYPPIIHLSVPREDLMDMPARAMAGFLQEWPLSLRGGRDWMQAVQDALPPAPPVPLVAPVPAPTPSRAFLPPVALAALVAGLASLVGLGVFGLAKLIEPAARPCDCRVEAPPAPPPVSMVPPLAPLAVPDAPPALPALPSLADLDPPPAVPQGPIAVAPPLPVLEPPLPGQVEAAPPVPQGQPAARYVATEDQIEQLMRRGRELAQRGDFSGARLFFERAAYAGSVEGALAAGRSHEPDAEAAGAWYRRAEELRARQN